MLVHFGFRQLLLSIPLHKEIVFHVRKKWKEREGFLTNYEMVYPRLSSLRWRFDYVFFQKKEMTETVLEKMCEHIVDVVYENFFPRQFFSKIYQAKNGNIYPTVRKNVVELLARIKKIKKRIFYIVNSSFDWYCKNKQGSYLFCNLKLIRCCSDHHFHFLLICNDKYVNRFFL